LLNRTRTFLIASLALNILLAVLWLSSRVPQRAGPTPEVFVEEPGQVHTNVVVRRQFFTWAELESPDYATYIANLRSIDCPEETIRDIIVADVDGLFAGRRSTEVLPTTQQWWQNKPDPAVLQAAYRQLNALESERERLLNQLLGPDWDRPATPVPTVAIKVPLEGPLLDTLPEETQERVQAVSGRIQQSFERILAAGGGQEPDPAAVAALERELRQQLTPLLTPVQLEELMVRYSPVARGLRAQLASLPLFDATSSEIQTLFRSVEQIDLQLMSLAGDGSSVEAQREALLRQREIAFQNALGPARYREYERLQDPAYRSAVATAEAAGITNAADLFYAIDRAGSEQEAGIRADTNLTPIQQEMALRELELEQLRAAAAALGQPALEEPPPPPPQTYSFREGDTLADVSLRTGVPVALLIRANPNLQAGNIAPGTQIIIPDRTAPYP